MAKIDIAIIADTLDPLDTATNFILGVARAIPNITVYTADGSSCESVKSMSTGWHKIPKIFRNDWFKKRRYSQLDLTRHNIVITTSPLAGFVTLGPKQKHIHYVSYSDLNIQCDKIRSKIAPTIHHYLADSEITRAALALSADSGSTILTPPVVTKNYRPARTREKYFVAHRSLQLKLPDMPIDIRYIDSIHDPLLASAWGYIALPDRLDPIILPALASGALVVAPKLLGDMVQSGESGTLYQDLSDIPGAIADCAKLSVFPASLQRKARRYDQVLFTTKIKKTLIDIYKS